MATGKTGSAGSVLLPPSPFLLLGHVCVSNLLLLYGGEMGHDIPPRNCLLPLE